MIGCAATVTCPSTKPSFHRNLSRLDSMCAPICRMPFCAHMQLLCDTCGLHAFVPCSVSHAIGKWHVRHRPPNTEPDMQPHTSPHTTLHSLVHSQRHTHTHTCTADRAHTLLAATARSVRLGLHAHLPRVFVFLRILLRGTSECSLRLTTTPNVTITVTIIPHPHSHPHSHSPNSPYRTTSPMAGLTTWTFTSR